MDYGVVLVACVRAPYPQLDQLVLTNERADGQTAMLAFGHTPPVILLLVPPAAVPSQISPTRARSPGPVSRHSVDCSAAHRYFTGFQLGGSAGQRRRTRSTIDLARLSLVRHKRHPETHPSYALPQRVCPPSPCVAVVPSAYAHGRSALALAIAATRRACGIHYDPSVPRRRVRPPPRVDGAQHDLLLPYVRRADHDEQRRIFGGGVQCAGPGGRTGLGAGRGAEGGEGEPVPGQGVLVRAVHPHDSHRGLGRPRGGDVEGNGLCQYRRGAARYQDRRCDGRAGSEVGQQVGEQRMWM